MNFFAENLKVFKKIFLPLFALVVLSTNIDQFLNLHIENAMMDASGSQRAVYMLGFLSILSSIVFPVLLVTTTLYALNMQTAWPMSLGDFLKKHLNQVYIETLRSWGKTLAWSLLLILPGIWKYVQYTFVPFVVTSSKTYELGKEDALKASSRIVKSNWFKIFLLLIFFQIFIPLILTSLFNAYRFVWKTPLQSLGLSLVDTYLILISTHILFNIFKREAIKHDAHV